MNKNSSKKTRSTATASVTPTPGHLPSMLHKRWVQFLILRGESNDRVHEFLVDDDLPPPPSDVLDAVRASLVPPRGFRPASKTHVPTRAFLEKLGLNVVFDLSPELQQALQLLRAPRPREIVEASVIGGVPPRVVVHIVTRLFGLQVSVEALRVYGDVFYDVAAVNRGQLRVLLEERVRVGILDVAPRIDPKQLRSLIASDARLVALSMPGSEIAWASTLMRLGWMPPRQELSTIVAQLESLSAFRLGQALLRGGPSDGKRAESCAGVLERVRRIKETVATPADELNKRLTQFQLVRGKETQISVHEIRARGDEVAVDNMPPTTTVWDRRDEEDSVQPPQT